MQNQFYTTSNEPEMAFTVPLDAIPHEPHEQARFLQAYFRDLLPTAYRNACSWRIVLERPADAAYYIDPQLQTGLDWLGGVSINDIYRYFQQKGRYLLCLHDCWTLFAWAEWYRHRDTGHELEGSVTVLHVDDHTDLMDPLLTGDGQPFEDIYTKRLLALNEPESVQQAVLSGAIGIGSFFVPFLYQAGRVNVRHLFPSGRLSDPGRFSIVKKGTPDALLRKGQSRPSVELQCVQPDGGNRSAVGCYLKTESLDEWLQDLPDDPILLHIDMDYFNNRFNGDSDWQKFGDGHDPSGSEVLRRIEEVLIALRSSGHCHRIEQVSIGLSPGFFPAELWEVSVSRIEQQLRGEGVV